MSESFDKPHTGVRYDTTNGEVVGYHAPNGITGKTKMIYHYRYSRVEYQKRVDRVIKAHGRTINAANLAFEMFYPSDQYYPSGKLS